ncbi:hypothetical protein A3Q56_06947, partial [Intoshia linei]
SWEPILGPRELLPNFEIDLDDITFENSYAELVEYEVYTDEDIIRIVNNNESVDDEELFEEDNTVEIINVNEAFEGLSKCIDFAELNNFSVEDINTFCNYFCQNIENNLYFVFQQIILLDEESYTDTSSEESAKNLKFFIRPIKQDECEVEAEEKNEIITAFSKIPLIIPSQRSLFKNVNNEVAVSLNCLNDNKSTEIEKTLSTSNIQDEPNLFNTLKFDFDSVKKQKQNKFETEFEKKFENIPLIDDDNVDNTMLGIYENNETLAQTKYLDEKPKSIPIKMSASCNLSQKSNNNASHSDPNPFWGKPRCEKFMVLILHNDIINSIDVNEPSTLSTLFNTFVDLDKLVYEAFLKLREHNISVSGTTLKAIELNVTKKLKIANFTHLMGGWRVLKKSSDKTQFDKFYVDYDNLKSKYKKDDIYNCDEIALYIKHLPSKSFVEKSDDCKDTIKNQRKNTPPFLLQFNR